jgi:hypothetical protein
MSRFDNRQAFLTNVSLAAIPELDRVGSRGFRTVDSYDGTDATVELLARDLDRFAVVEFWLIAHRQDDN